MPDTQTPARPEPLGRVELITGFTPVPRRQERADSWSAEVQRAFIEYLADLGSVTEACRLVGRSTSSAYRLKREPGAEGFVAAWSAALAFALGQVEDNAIDRAINGVEVPVFAYRDQIATRRVYNDRLVMFMLRNHAPDRYCEGGARGLSAIDKRRLERMKREWRAEWEAEQEESEESEEEVLDSIDTFLGNMRQRRLSGMSPAQRATEIAAKAQAKADEEAGWRPGLRYEPYAEKAAELLPRFIEEVEKDWPEPGPCVEDEANADEWDGEDPIALPPPGWRKSDEPPAEPPSGPRVHGITDDGWD